MNANNQYLPQAEPSVIKKTISFLMSVVALAMLWFILVTTAMTMLYALWRVTIGESLSDIIAWTTNTAYWIAAQLLSVAIVLFFQYALNHPHKKF